LTTPVRPPALEPGDRVALLAPAGPARGPEELDACRAALEALGLRVVPGRAITHRADYLAGEDRARADDLNRAWNDCRIRGIFCVRGGYGSGRLMPLLDWDAARRHPKLFAGFSDLTSLLNGLLARANVMALHAPTVATAYVNDPVSAASRAWLGDLAFGRRDGRDLAPWLGARETRWIVPGPIRGRLVGGNLTVFCTLLGTRALPSPRGKVLFLEDIGEEPYRLDRCLNHLRQTDYLARVNGVILGQFTRCHSRHAGRSGCDEVLDRCLRDLGVPVLAGVPCGHGRHTGSFWIGERIAWAP
jgi:muramoyltetrapeptide carboxypeptidase